MRLLKRAWSTTSLSPEVDALDATVGEPVSYLKLFLVARAGGARVAEALAAHAPPAIAIVALPVGQPPRPIMFPLERRVATMGATAMCMKLKLVMVLLAPPL